MTKIKQLIKQLAALTIAVLTLSGVVSFRAGSLGLLLLIAWNYCGIIARTHEEEEEADKQ